jgi:glycosyltransferase involved in cell wall biosynthesis
MRILYLHQFFMTRAGIGGTRSYEFARRFVEQGHQVTMVTAGDGGRRVEDGIEVVSVPAGFGDYVRATKLGYGRRALEFARFAAAATRTVLRLPRPDVIYATSPPLTMALPAMAASKRFRTPLVFEVRDLWPEAPIQMGALPNPALQRVARLLEHTVYRNAAHVNALSPGMRDGVVAAGVPPERVSMIPNASDLDMFDPDLDGTDMRERLGLGDGFVCSYFGTMGEANDLTQVVDAAPHAPDVTFVLHGDGKRREALIERARGVDNIVFSEPIPDKTSVARLAAASDACMTIYKDVPILATCSPNKLFDTFAAGRPAVVNCEGWMRSLVEENDAGVFARPGDPADLAAKVESLRGRTEEMGRNARALAEREFDRDLLAGRMLEVLERVAQTR